MAATQPQRISQEATTRLALTGSKPKSLSTSNCQKREIRALQEEAAELEEIVKCLEGGILSRVWQIGDRSAVGTDRLAVGEPKWKQVARCEVERFRRSADENRKLRENVASQKHLTKCLRHELTKRMAQIAVR